MKRLVRSQVVWVCAALAATSAFVWAAPVIRSVRSLPGLLAVGQSAAAPVSKLPLGLESLKADTLTIVEKAALFEKAGFTVPNGVVTRATFTPMRPLIARQGMINLAQPLYYASGSPTESAYTGYAQMRGNGGTIDLGFIPFLVNQPALVVFSIGTQIGDTVFNLKAGGQTQQVTLPLGAHNVACLVTPSTKDLQWVTLRSVGGNDWAFYSAEVTVQK